MRMRNLTRGGTTPSGADASVAMETDPRMEVRRHDLTLYIVITTHRMVYILMKYIDFIVIDGHSYRFSVRVYCSVPKHAITTYRRRLVCCHGNGSSDADDNAHGHGQYIQNHKDVMNYICIDVQVVTPMPISIVHRKLHKMIMDAFIIIYRVNMMWSTRKN